MTDAAPWLILGPGALGRLLAARLAGQVPLALVGRRASDAPLTLTTPESDTLLRQVSRIVASQAPQRPAVLHLTTKAYAAERALGDIASHIAAATPLVLWQNGFAIQPALTRRWPGPVLCASTTEGAHVRGDDAVVHAGHGHTFLGHLGGEHRQLATGIAATLAAAGLPATPCADIRDRLWHKLVVNAAINPLVARYRIRNGQLRDRPFRPMVTALLIELESIVTAEAIAAPPRGWEDLVWDVIAATAGNRASMLQDVLAGRPTERDAILGPLRDAARRHGLATPRLDTLWKDTPG